MKSVTLIYSTLQTNTDVNVNSVYPDDTAHNEPSLHDLHYLNYTWHSCFQQLICQNSKMEESTP